MVSIFSKNGILSGRIDHYCLICEEQFTNEEETLAHIVNSQHKENLQTCGYYEKYKEDFIRKAKGIYFCELCSLTLPTATKVALHIDEPTHIEEKNKSAPCLIRIENDIIVFNKFFITDDAWNGCVEDTCVICNTEFDDSASHKVIRSHVLNLIKSEVIFDKVEAVVYRTIDARSKQCLTCNIIIGNDPTSHFKTAEHKEAYKMYVHSGPTNDTKNTTKSSKNTNAAKESHQVKVNIEKADKNIVIGDVNEAVNRDANENVKKDIKKDASKGIKKDARKNIKKDASKNIKKDAKKEATKADKEKVKEKSKQSATEENAEELDKIYCKNLGAKNYVTGDFGNSWCVLCEWVLEGSPEDHIRGKHHQTLLKLHKEKIAENLNKKVPSKDEKSNLHDSADRYQKSNVTIDLINETAFCKKCCKNIDFNYDAIDKHIEEHKKTSDKKSQENAVPFSSGMKSNGTDRTTLYTSPVLFTAGKEENSQSTVKVGDYAKQQGLTYNRADNSYYCHPCSRRLPTALDDLQKHVASRIHTENTKQSTKTAATEAPLKEPLFDFIETFDLVESMTEESIVIINKKYLINPFSFFLIAKKNERIFCHGCHIDLIPENVSEHLVMSDNHRGIIEKCLFITSLENEFIREIKLDVYHCGYCNITTNDWDDILEHTATAEHKKLKSESEQSLRNFNQNLYHRNNSREINEMIRLFALHKRLGSWPMIDDWKKQINHVKRVENEYRQREIFQDDDNLSFIINTGESSSDDDEFDDNDEYSDSDTEKSGIEVLNSD